MSEERQPSSVPAPSGGQSAARAAARPTRGRGAVFWLLAPAALALLLGALAFFAWVERAYLPGASAVEQRASEAQARVQEALGEARALRGEVQSVRAEVESLRSALESGREQQAALAAEQAELRQAVGALAAGPREARARWALAEVEFLLRAAAQRLQLERDVASARAALELADQRLSELDDPRYTPVREALAADLTALAGVQMPEVTGLALELAELTRQLGALPLRSEAAAAPAAVAPEAAEAPASQPAGWRQALSAVWQALRSYVVVRRKDPADELAFDPAARQLLVEGLRAELMSARLAVLRRDSANLRASAALVTERLQGAFDTGDARVSHALEVLRSAATAELDAPLPNLAGTLELLRRSAEAAVLPSPTPSFAAPPAP